MWFSLSASALESGGDHNSKLDIPDCARAVAWGPVEPQRASSESMPGRGYKGGKSRQGRPRKPSPWGCLCVWELVGRVAKEALECRVLTLWMPGATAGLELEELLGE